MMIDLQLIELLKRIGFVNADGVRIYGSAAVLHYLYSPVEFDNAAIKRGRKWVEAYLASHNA